MRMILLVTMVALAAVPALARESACVADARTHCPDIPPGDGRVVACLKAKWSDLSSSCQQDFQEHQSRVASMNLSCANDLWQLCQGVVPGQGRIYSCLISGWDRVSS